MADQKINIPITVKGAKKAKDQLGGVSGSIRKLGSAIVATSAAYFGTRGLISAISTSTELAGIQEQAEKRLEVALGRTSTALLSQASALQKVTTFGDESIIGVQASIAAFVDSEEAIKKATAATLDIAVAMGMDLQAAGDLVAKTLGSSTNAMSRYGIEVTGAVGSTERLESLTNNVAELFGGQASAQAETYAGSVQQLKNELGDMAEGIGRLLIPAFETLAPHIKGMIRFYSDLFNIQEKVNSQSSKHSVELEKMNNLIQFQRDRLEGLTAANILNLREDENALGVAERARDQRRTTTEQLRHEKQVLGELIAERFNLKNAIEEVPRPITVVASDQSEILDDLMIDMDEMNALMEESFNFGEIIKKQKEEQIMLDLKNAALSGQSARDAMKSVVRAETMEAVAGYIASVLKSVPFPANVILAAGGGGLVAGLVDKGLQSFATGGIVQGNPSQGDVNPAMLTAGEVILNQAQQDNLVGNMSGITLNISGGIVDESYVNNELIPALNKATALGNKINA